MEALIEDFTAMAGSGMLTVVVQNSGSVTSDYSVSITYKADMYSSVFRT